MKTRDLFFDLPSELIAQDPPEERGQSRLMVASRRTAELSHSLVSDLPGLIAPGTVMVFNDSRVRRARVYGRSVETGKEQEFLLVAPKEGNLEEIHRCWYVIGPRARKLTLGKRFTFDPGDLEATITAHGEPYRELTFSRALSEEWFEQFGHIPLPPYIHRDDSPQDAQRYQTVYARTTGSVAAPTAGLHFTPTLMEQLRNRGVIVQFVTLHVGLGTFLPVRTEVLEDHVMHREEYSIPEQTAEAVTVASREGRPVLAVGTTAVRTLESAAIGDEGDRSTGIRPGSGITGIFIYPGYRFRIVDQLFTNFHTPGSTLIALVSAFAGQDNIRSWYSEAIRERYRFFSYGDAMLIR